MTEKTIKLLCELAINWETQAHELYLKFAKLFSHEPTISAFWVQLSKDESGHINVLKDMLQKMQKEKLLMEVSNETWNSVMRVEGLIREATSSKIKTLDDAYELAHQLEISEVNTIFKMLAIECMPDEEGNKFILSDVNAHINRLMKFREEYPQSQRKHITVLRN